MHLSPELFLRLSIAGSILLSGCAGQTFAPDAAPEYVIVHPGVPFYHLGPQQAGPPDQRLGLNDRVRMLRREFGYSLMKLPDGETGYVANEDLSPAPPVSAPEAAPARQAGANPVTPALDEEPLPKPDLEAPQADAPAN